MYPKSNNNREMRNYIITYSYPAKYRGTYLVTAVDGIEASKKISTYLKETFGDTDTSSSIVLEVEGSAIQIIG